MTIQSIQAIQAIHKTEHTGSIQLSNDQKSAPNTRLKKKKKNKKNRQPLEELHNALAKGKISDKVICNVPSDKYFTLLKLLEEMLSGSVDKYV